MTLHAVDRSSTHVAMAEGSPSPGSIDSSSSSSSNSSPSPQLERFLDNNYELQVTATLAMLCQPHHHKNSAAFWYIKVLGVCVDIVGQQAWQKQLSPQSSLRIACFSMYCMQWATCRSLLVLVSLTPFKPLA